MYDFENYFYPFIITRITWSFVNTFFIQGNFGCNVFFSILSKNDYFRSKFVKSSIFRLIIPKNSQIWSVLFNFDSVLPILWHICCSNTFLLSFMRILKSKLESLTKNRLFYIKNHSFWLLSNIWGENFSLPKIFNKKARFWSMTLVLISKCA